MIISIKDREDFKQKALRWASSFSVFCYLDSNDFNDPYKKFDALIAIGAKDELVAMAGTAFDQLEQFRKKHPDWITGFLGYDLKNEILKTIHLVEKWEAYSFITRTNGIIVANLSKVKKGPRSLFCCS